jgi:opacity protein-like surface antigen
MLKKSFLTLSLFLSVLFAAQAQFGVSAGVLYGTDSELGFTGRVNYNINSKISIFAGYSLLSSESEKDPLTGLEASASVNSIDLDGHYHFSDGATKPYALVGISIWRVKAEVLGLSVSDSQTGFNVGGGVLHSLSDKFSIFGEAKYVIIDGGQAVITAGAHYGF